MVPPKAELDPRYNWTRFVSLNNSGGTPLFKLFPFKNKYVASQNIFNAIITQWYCNRVKLPRQGGMAPVNPPLGML